MGSTHLGSSHAEAEAAADILRTTTAIRERAAQLLARVRNGESPWFVVDETAHSTAQPVAPFRSRWHRPQGPSRRDAGHPPSAGPYPLANRPHGRERAAGWRRRRRLGICRARQRQDLHPLRRAGRGELPRFCRWPVLQQQEPPAAGRFRRLAGLGDRPPGVGLPGARGQPAGRPGGARHHAAAPGRNHVGAARGVRRGWPAQRHVRHDHQPAGAGRSAYGRRDRARHPVAAAGQPVRHLAGRQFDRFGAAGRLLAPFCRARGRPVRRLDAVPQAVSKACPTAGCRSTSCLSG
jgi:hypothetical protein